MRSALAITPAPALTLAVLTPAERALVDAVRHWFRSRGGGTLATIRLRLQRGGAPAAALLPLFALMGVLETGRALPLDLHGPQDGRLTGDEARLLDTLAAIQAEEADIALELLETWLHPAALGMAVCAARDLAATLTDAGLFLPGGRSGAGFGRLYGIAAE